MCQHSNHMPQLQSDTASTNVDSLLCTQPALQQLQNWQSATRKCAQKYQSCILITAPGTPQFVMFMSCMLTLCLFLYRKMLMLALVHYLTCISSSVCMIWDLYPDSSSKLRHKTTQVHSHICRAHSTHTKEDHSHPHTLRILTQRKILHMFTLYTQSQKNFL